MKKAMLTVMALASTVMVYATSGCSINKKTDSEINVTINTPVQESSSRSTEPASSSTELTIHPQMEIGKIT